MGTAQMWVDQSKLTKNFQGTLGWHYFWYIYTSTLYWNDSNNMNIHWSIEFATIISFRLTQHYPLLPLGRTVYSKFGIEWSGLYLSSLFFAICTIPPLSFAPLSRRCWSRESIHVAPLFSGWLLLVFQDKAFSFRKPGLQKLPKFMHYRYC